MVSTAASEVDRAFTTLAIGEARQSHDESDTRAHPRVGVVIAKDNKLLAKAHRGELSPGEHAEFTALERKLASALVSGATVYTTLEPRTTRQHPKCPCAEWLIKRKVSRVVIGMLDPNPSISGRGQRRLREANIVIDNFTPELMAMVEELNRNFI